MKRRFFQAVVVSILLYGCTTWTLTKQLEKKLDGNYTRMRQAILNKSWRQHPTRYQLYGHLPSVTKTIQVRQTRHAGHGWRSRDELISDVLLWTPTYGWAKAGRPAPTYIQQLCEDTGCSPEDLPEAMNDWERGSGISVLVAWHDDDDDGSSQTCLLDFVYQWVCCDFLAALSAFSFPWIPMWLSIQHRMIVLFLRRVLILFINLSMNGFVRSLFFWANSVDFESEKMWRLIKKFFFFNFKKVAVLRSPWQEVGVAYA